VGAHGQLTPGPNASSHGTGYKRSKKIFPGISIPLTLDHISTRLLEIPAQSLIGSPGATRILQAVHQDVDVTSLQEGTGTWPNYLANLLDSERKLAQVLK